MSAPTTFQYAVVKVGDGESPENFTTVCGIQTTGFNETAETAKKSVRDCANPAIPPEQRVLVTSHSRQLTGSGLYNIGQTALLNTLVGYKRNYQFVMLDISDPDVPQGTELGTWQGPGVASALNLATTDNGDATISITVESDGTWSFTPAS